MEWPHPHIQVPPLEASPCLQRMATSHVLNIAVEPFEEVGDDKGLSKNESDSFPIMAFKIIFLLILLLSDLLPIFAEDIKHLKSEEYGTANITIQSSSTPAIGYDVFCKDSRSS